MSGRGQAGWRRTAVNIGAVAVVHFVVTAEWMSHMYSWWQVRLVGPTRVVLLWWPADVVSRLRLASRLSDLTSDTPLIWMTGHLTVSLLWAVTLCGVWWLAQAIRRRRRAT